MECGITFNYRSRYCKLGSLDQPHAQLWFVLHGYGQLAPYFIQKFQFLANLGHCIIAPEGLNRFYLKGFSGRVGATWMTKEGRLDDIENYVNYLNTVYQQEAVSRPNAKVNLLGFSQGTATVCRWIAQSTIDYHRLFIWAGMMPEDLQLENARKRLSNKPIYLVYGNEDIFITKGRLAGQQRVIKSLQIEPMQITFAGDHDIHEDTLMNIISDDHPQ